MMEKLCQQRPTPPPTPTAIQEEEQQQLPQKPRSTDTPSDDPPPNESTTETKDETPTTTTTYPNINGNSRKILRALQLIKHGHLPSPVTNQKRSERLKDRNRTLRLQGLNPTLQQHQLWHTAAKQTRYERLKDFNLTTQSPSSSINQLRRERLKDRNRLQYSELTL